MSGAQSQCPGRCHHRKVTPKTSPGGLVQDGMCFSGSRSGRDVAAACPPAGRWRGAGEPVGGLLTRRQPPALQLLPAPGTGCPRQCTASWHMALAFLLCAPFPDIVRGRCEPSRPQPSGPVVAPPHLGWGAPRPQPRPRAPRKLSGDLGVVFSALSPALPRRWAPFLCRLGACPPPSPLSSGEALGCPGGPRLWWWPACRSG